MTAASNEQEPTLPGTGVPRRRAPVVRCRECHRPLRAPESRWERLGPYCATAPDRTPRYDIDQDPIPGT